MDRLGLSQQHSASPDSAVLCSPLSAAAQLAAAEEKQTPSCSYNYRAASLPLPRPSCVTLSLPLGSVNQDLVLQIRGKDLFWPSLAKVTNSATLQNREEKRPWRASSYFSPIKQLLGGERQLATDPSVTPAGRAAQGAAPCGARQGRPDRVPLSVCPALPWRSSQLLTATLLLLHSPVRPRARHARGKHPERPPALLWPRRGRGCRCRAPPPTHTGQRGGPAVPRPLTATNGPARAARPLPAPGREGAVGAEGRRRQLAHPPSPPTAPRATGALPSTPSRQRKEAPGPLQGQPIPGGGRESGGRSGRRSRWSPREQEAEGGGRQRRGGGARYLTVCHGHVRVLLSRLHLQLQGFLAGAGELQPRRQLLLGEQQLHAAPQQQLLRVRRRSGHDPAAPRRQPDESGSGAAAAASSCQPGGRQLRQGQVRWGGFTDRPLPRLRRLPRHLYPRPRRAPQPLHRALAR